LGIGFGQVKNKGGNMTEAKKGFFARLMEKLDKKPVDSAKKSSCCCCSAEPKSDEKDKKSSCCG